MDPRTLALISRRTLIRAVVVAAVIAIGVVSVHAIESALNLHFTKERMYLARPLPLLSKEFGVSGRYIAEGYDVNLDEAIVEVLGTRDYLQRTYHDREKTAGNPAEFLYLNLNFYGIGSSSPHVPEICWAGAGMLEAKSSRQIFDIPNVRRKDGSVVTLHARIISFLPRGEAEDPNRLKNVIYIFNVNGDYVATPQEVLSRFWKASNKYAYDTKIEVTVGGDKQYCSQEQAQAAVSDFLRASLSEIESCLPDPGAASAAGTVSGGVNRPGEIK